MEEINAHSNEVEVVIKALNTDIDSGLTETEVQARLEKYGKNELVKEKGKTALQIFIGQFKDFLIYLLIFAIYYSYYFTYIFFITINSFLKLSLKSLLFKTSCTLILSINSIIKFSDNF